MLTYKQISKLAKPYTDAEIVRRSTGRLAGQYLVGQNWWGNGYIAILQSEGPRKPPKNYDSISATVAQDGVINDLYQIAPSPAWLVELRPWKDADDITVARLLTAEGSVWVDARYLAALLKHDPSADIFVNHKSHTILVRNGHTIGVVMTVQAPHTDTPDWRLRNEDTPLNPYTRFYSLRDGVHYTSAEVREACLQVAVNGQLVPLNPIPQPITPEPEPIAEAAQEPCSRCKGTGKVGDLDWRRLISICPVCHGTGHKTEPEPAIVAEPVTESEPEPQPVAVTVPELSKVDRLAVALAGLGVTEIYTDNGQTCAVWERVDLPAQQALRRTVTGTLKGAGFSVRARYEGSALYITC